MLVDADKAREKLARAVESFRLEHGDFCEWASDTIRQTDLTDCKATIELEKGVADALRNDVIESLSAQVAELTKEVERLRLPPEETLSGHPGCVFCMEVGTPVRPGEVCPKCGDRLPTREEYSLRAQVAELKKALAAKEGK